MIKKVEILIKAETLVKLFRLVEIFEEFFSFKIVFGKIKIRLLFGKYFILINIYYRQTFTAMFC